MKKIISISIIIFIISAILINSSFSAEKSSSYSERSGYKLYKQRVEDICSKYLHKNNDKQNGKIRKLIELNNEYLEINNENNYNIKKVKNKHINNMNNIYKCALLTTQKKSFLIIKNDLTKKNPSLAKKISKEIDHKINTITLTSRKLKCIESKEKEPIQKINVLKQATYQTCKYISYLEYLKEENKKIANLVEKDSSITKKYNIKDIINTEKQKIKEIDDEIEHTYRVFPLAFHAYTEYENNITIHLLLELIKKDYHTLREQLHKSINPINQAVYKFSNVMKK